MSPKAYGHTKTEDRQPADFYPTPDPLALACCKAVAELYPSPDFIIEPSAGAGAFVRGIRQAWGNAVPLLAVELRSEEQWVLRGAGASAVFTGDFLDWLARTPLDRRALVIGNPPYSLAQEHILACLDYLLPGSAVAFLLKLGFLGTQTRAEGLWPHGQCRYIQPILGRPSFVVGNAATSDVNEYGLFIWEVGYTGPPVIRLPHIRWKKGRKSNAQA